jgi:orotate phosphoribosyltransferase
VSSFDALIKLLRDRSVQTGDFLLSSGRRSTYYIDARLTTMSGEGLQLIGELGLKAIRTAGWQPGAVGGLTLGADPVAYAIAAASVRLPPIIDGFTVRKDSKGHGTKKRIEGGFRAGLEVVVTEDVITTGGSTLQAIEAIRAEGGVVLGVLAVVDREEGGVETIEAEGVRVVSLTTTTALGLR